MRLFLALFAGLTAVSPVYAQVVTLSGVQTDSAAILLQQLLDRGRYLLVDRDTVLSGDVVVDGDLVIFDARVVLEGTVNGVVAVVQGDFFPRPDSRVTGSILVLGRGAYPSARAEVGDVIRLDARIAVEVQANPRGYDIMLRPPPGRGVLRLPGVYGVLLPTYDRVNGLSLRGAAELGFGGDTAAFAVIGALGYRANRSRWDGGMELRLRPSPRSYVSIAGSRRTHTADAWIRDDLANSLSSILVRSDVRNYFESDEVAVAIARAPPPPLIQGESFIAPRVTLRLSRDRSLESAAPWSLLRGDEPWRFNPPIDDGVLGSVTGGAAAGWRGITARASGAVGVEWSPTGIGDFDFAQISAAADWWILALRGHEIEARGYVLLPLSGAVPRQRWSLMGGPGTLPTLPAAAMRGDHVLFLRTVYLAAMPAVRIPFLPPPSLRLEYAVGTAWATGNPRPFLEQNVGAGIQLSIFSATVFVDPADRPLRAVLSLGAQLPTGRTSGAF